MQPAKPPSEADLRERIDRALAYNVAHRHMRQDTNAAWQVVHGILVYGPDLQMYKDGKLVSALDYLLRGNPLNGWNLRPADHGVLSILEAGSKTGMGHPDQWIGYLSQCGLSLDEPLKVGGGDYKVRDLLTQSQWDIYPGMEATWTLMAASTYLPLDVKWTARDGSEWTIDRIVDMEADADLNSAACGGSHRMYALAIALNRHLAAGGALTGPWLKADAKIKQAIETIKANQQPDGTFSTNYFIRPSTSNDMGERLGTTGHTFEFLTVALDDRQIQEPWFQRALLAQLDMLERMADLELECGGLYHTLHGLQLYRTRVYGSAEGQPAAEPATSRSDTPQPTGAEPAAAVDETGAAPAPPRTRAARTNHADNASAYSTPQGFTSIAVGSAHGPHATREPARPRRGRTKGGRVDANCPTPRRGHGNPERCDPFRGGDALLTPHSRGALPAAMDSCPWRGVGRLSAVVRGGRWIGNTLPFGCRSGAFGRCRLGPFRRGRGFAGRRLGGFFAWRILRAA